MRTAASERDNRPEIFFAISIALHLLVFWAWVTPFLASLELPDLRPVIEIVALPEAFRSLRSPARPAPVPPAPEARPAPELNEQPAPIPPPKPPPTRFHDIVDIPRPAVEEPPRDARFLAEYNQRVARPARARDRPIDTRGDVSKRKAVDPLAKFSDRQSDKRASEAQAAREAQQARARAVAGGGGGGRSASRADAPGEAGPPERVDPNAIFRKKKIGDGGERAATGPVGPGEGLKDLLPKEERLAQLEAASVGGANHPYNPDLVPVDAEMSMDTLKYDHVGYYLTIKRGLRRNWDPDRLIRSADTSYRQTLRNFGGNSTLSRGAGSNLAEAIARTGRGTTVIGFTILKTGLLEAEPVMLHSSGSAFLDEEALRAVRLGGPFPPVPDRIAKSSLKLTWGFIYGRRGP